MPDSSEAQVRDAALPAAAAVERLLAAQAELQEVEGLLHVLDEDLAALRDNLCGACQPHLDRLPRRWK